MTIKDLKEWLANMPEGVTDNTPVRILFNLHGDDGFDISDDVANIVVERNGSKGSVKSVFICNPERL